jgi:hypothetical protein
VPAAVWHFNHAHKFPSKLFAQYRHASVLGNAGGTKASCNPILITGAISGRPNVPGKNVTLTIGVSIEISVQSMRNAAQIHNLPSHLTTQML